MSYFCLNKILSRSVSSFGIPLIRIIKSSSASKNDEGPRAPREKLSMSSRRRPVIYFTLVLHFDYLAPFQHYQVDNKRRQYLKRSEAGTFCKGTFHVDNGHFSNFNSNT